mgnify:CR=1 FL=1
MNKKMINTDIFRLAAVLYADNNYEVNPKTIYRRIIESILLDNNNDVIGIHTLIDTIKAKYELDFTFEEIQEIIKDDKYFNSSYKNEDIKISIVHNRFKTLCENVKHKNLDYFISEFQKINTDISLEELREIIYSFLYEVFQTNINSFSKLINPEILLEDLIDIKDLKKMSKLNIEIINSFLNWNNDDKNKIIFNISSLALEYCLITNKKGKNIRLENLKNKSFYLDTNIIFRAIGLNGENRRKRTITFLEKFKEANEKLYISSFTNEEIKNTLEYYIGQISRVSTTKINSKIFIKFRKYEDFFDFYHCWRKDRINDSTDIFLAHINSLIENLKKDFNIVNAYKESFDVRESKINEEIMDIASQINNFKTEHKGMSSLIETSLTDAKNIYLIENLRAGKYVNIFDCKYYLISSDQQLRKWDYIKNTSIPIVLLPSQWMSILLRYLNRTNDDFKSFVSFLNINNNEKGISNENLQLILDGISEITSDFEKQNEIVEALINNKVKDIITSSRTDTEIVERAKKFAESELEKRIHNLEKDNSKLETRFDKYQKDTTSAIENLKRLKNSEKKEKDELSKQYKEIKEDLIAINVSNAIRKYKRIGYFYILGIFICCAILLFTFYFQNENWNIMTNLLDLANLYKEGSIQRNIIDYISLIPITGVVIFSKGVYNHFLNKQKLEEQKTKIIKEIENKYINSQSKKTSPN